ncbi:MAG: NAD(P)H-hydrate dehydratase [Sphingomonadaceae bacterium]
MRRANSQILTVAQMQAAEQALVDAGISVDELMQRAGRGAAEYAWRMAAGGAVTVLCGPGNNGGDGYVIAEVMRARGLDVVVVAPMEPKTAAARTARALYTGPIRSDGEHVQGTVLVDCLFGSGLSRGLSGDLLMLLTSLAECHPLRIAVDLPSGVESDSGAVLSPVPDYQLTVALGAWKRAHYLMPAMQHCGALRLVDIGCDRELGAGRLLGRPELSAPAPDAHKYRRGMLGVVAGEMPGASLLAAQAAMRGGAGYVKLLAAGEDVAVPADLVVSLQPLDEALADPRFAALLVGPGLGRGHLGRDRLAAALRANTPLVLDADALVLLQCESLGAHSSPRIATPHAGELAALEAAFSLSGKGSKPDRALALAQAMGAVVIAKGPDTVIAGPDGALVFAPPVSSWLSTAGTGDVLAGLAASRLATGTDPLTAACEAVWLHGEAARRAGPAFTASQLAAQARAAYASCL